MKRFYSKNEFILSRCKNKSVLDLGCIEHDLFQERMKKKEWLHMNIQKVAKSLIGVDILKEYIIELNKKGFNIIFGNVEKLDEVAELKGKNFDVIVAGDLIEHLFNQGNFINSLKPFFKENTEVIITTPNCFSTKFMIPYFFCGKEKVREDHTCWFSINTLKQLLELNGFIVTESYFRSDLKINGIRPFFRVTFRKLFPRICEGLIIVAKMK
jgi:2-polyprenyl-3-methyl-5-hydroxy-6-metoxy-1,4-benzoquinol methylase